MCCVYTDSSFETHWTENMYIAIEIQNRHIIWNMHLDLIFPLKKFADVSLYIHLWLKWIAI